MRCFGFCFSLSADVDYLRRPRCCRCLLTYTCDHHSRPSYGENSLTYHTYCERDYVYKVISENLWHIHFPSACFYYVLYVVATQVCHCRDSNILISSCKVNALSARSFTRGPRNVKKKKGFLFINKYLIFLNPCELVLVSFKL